jgi:uncharacterized membrane protein YdjX (TVP38/TMEM64 family)
MSTRRVWLLIVLLLAAIIVPFIIWGERFDVALSVEGARAWMQAYGRWAWLAGIVLLCADIVLPIPGTVVMSALGLMYGWWWGGLTAALGSWLSGIIAYAVCRYTGHGAARWIAGEEGLQKVEALFARQGGWLVALSRCLPVLPEAVACLAGVARMSWRTFMLALTCGSLPLGFAFAAIGATAELHPTLALLLSAGVPVLLWWAARHTLSR